MKSLFKFCSILVIALSACTSNENNKMIVGNWKGEEWLVNGAPSSFDGKKAAFTFNDKGDYSFTLRRQ